MPLWSHDSPPIYFPNAVLTKSGWVDPETGEILVTLNDSENQIGPGSDLRRHLQGSSRIQARALRLQTGNSAVRVTTTQQQSANTRVQTINITTRTGVSRIQATTNRTVTGRSSVRQTNSQTVIGNTSIRVTQPQNLDGAAKVVYRLSNLPNLLVEYPFYQQTDSLVIQDFAEGQKHGTLDANGSWTNLGLRLDGTQTISIPNSVLVPSHKDFTVFIIAQQEDDMTDPGHLIRWGSDTGIRQAFDVYVDDDDQLAVDLQGDGWKDKFAPTTNVPFAMVTRYNAEGRQLDTRIAENSERATCVGVYDYFNNGTTHFLAENGKVGLGFKGTLIYLAIFDRLLSNGEVSHLLKFAYLTLLIRDTEEAPVPG